MIGWGKEDTELSVRLMNKGIQKNKLKCLAICYHLHHNISSRSGQNTSSTVCSTYFKIRKHFERKHKYLPPDLDDVKLILE